MRDIGLHISSMAYVTTMEKLKLFQSVKKFQQIQGICPPSPHQRTPFNGRNLFILFCFAQMFLSATAFILFEAQSMYEFGLTLYASLTELQTFTCFICILCKITKYFELIENMENFIAKSK